MSTMTVVSRPRHRGAVDDIRVTSDRAVTARTLVDGGPHADLLPLTAVRQAVTELVAHARGPGWRACVHDVAVLQLFQRPVAGDIVTTTVTCSPGGTDQIVASGRCVCGDTVLATITARLTLEQEPTR